MPLVNGKLDGHCTVTKGRTTQQMADYRYHYVCPFTEKITYNVLHSAKILNLKF